MKNIKIVIKTKNENYPLIIGNNIIRKTGLFIKKYIPRVKKIGIITDKNLPIKMLSNLKQSLNQYDLSIYKLNSGEKTKNVRTAHYLIEEILKKNFNRSDCIIALGGGAFINEEINILSLVLLIWVFVSIMFTLVRPQGNVKRCNTILSTLQTLE